MYVKHLLKTVYKLYICVCIYTHVYGEYNNRVMSALKSILRNVSIFLS